MKKKRRILQNENDRITGPCGPHVHFRTASRAGGTGNGKHIHAGMERSDACTQPAASFALADYAAETEDESYCLLWEAMNAEFEQLGAQGYPAARCVYADDTLMVYV